MAERAGVDEFAATGSDEATAADATMAVLTTLGERLSEDHSRGLAAELPGEIGEHLTAGASGQRFSEAEFISRVDQRLDTLDITGEQAATAVLGVVLEAVGSAQRAAVIDQFEHYSYEDLVSETDAAVDVRDRSPRER